MCKCSLILLLYSSIQSDLKSYFGIITFLQNHICFMVSSFCDSSMFFFYMCEMYHYYFQALSQQFDQSSIHIISSVRGVGSWTTHPKSPRARADPPRNYAWRELSLSELCCSYSSLALFLGLQRNQAIATHPTSSSTVGPTYNSSAVLVNGTCSIYRNATLKHSSYGA